MLFLAAKDATELAQLTKNFPAPALLKDCSQFCSCTGRKGLKEAEKALKANTCRAAER